MGWGRDRDGPALPFAFWDPLERLMADDETEVRFETALEQLEETVEALQRGEPELSKALAQYEKGLALLGQCYGLLERAERAVALLTGLDDDGEPITTPFDDAATLEAEADSKPKAQPPKPPARRRAKPTPPQPKPEPAPESEYDRFDPPF